MGADANPPEGNLFEIANVSTPEGQRQLADAVVVRAKQLYWRKESVTDEIAGKPRSYAACDAAMDTITELIGLDLNPFDLVAIIGKNVSSNYQGNTIIFDNTDVNDLIGKNPIDLAKNVAAGLLENEMLLDPEIDTEVSRRYEQYDNF
jgi:hypothetical protein